MSDVRDKADAVFVRLRSLFIWMADLVRWGVPEHWASHIDAYEAGLAIADDCDGFALTAAEALLRSGVPPAQIWIVCCWTETGDYHCVCFAVEIKDGATVAWVMDNRQRSVWRHDRLPYRWDKGHTYDAPADWFSLRNMNDDGRGA